MIALDASIVIKWFVQEDGSEAALGYREKVLKGLEEIAVPDLLIYEVINALRFKKGVSEEGINSILPSFFSIGLEIISPTEKLMRDALRLSFTTGLSIYDSVYLAVANEVGGSLITADKQILQQAEPFAKIQVLGYK